MRRECEGCLPSTSQGKRLGRNEAYSTYLGLPEAGSHEARTMSVYFQILCGHLLCQPCQTGPDV